MAKPGSAFSPARALILVEAMLGMKACCRDR